MIRKLPTADLTIAQLIDGLIAAAREVGEVLATDQDGELDPTDAAAVEQAWKTALQARTADLAIDNLAKGRRMADQLTGHVVEPNPIQTQAEGLSRAESMAAYDAVSAKFRLRGPQRSKLDRSPLYSEILNRAFMDQWKIVERLLGQAGIIE